MDNLDIVSLNDVLARSDSSAPGPGRRTHEDLISEPARRSLEILRGRSKGAPTGIMRAAWTLAAARLTGAKAVTLAEVSTGGERITLQRIAVEDDATVSG